MKNKNQTTTVLMALAYLIEKKNLSKADIKSIIIKTAEEIEK